MTVSTRRAGSGDEGQAESRTEGDLLGLLGGLIPTGDLGSLVESLLDQLDSGQGAALYRTPRSGRG
ncbi:MAG: hypothetical protein FJ011_04200 [Chloroflexi bacterium]|nr:hypothetical protein [Chloroflexota bacterium]